ncbi:hypothetical protein [Neobacillus drentensis]|uniref:hypothetical protein n=1 Tax=Neobacillus drentensis TaxID=220684 RepID=UPI00300116FE
MAAKKDNLKESLKEEKQDEVITVDGEKEASLSSLDLLWRHAFHELDEWAKCTDHRDDVCLKEVRRFSESVQRNQGNIKAIAEQFTKELTEWEKIARDEFLMSTTTLQHFFPIQSYEETNEQIDQIQKRVLSLLSTPYQTIANCQSMEKYEEMIDQYMDLRKKGRSQYIEIVKQAGSPLYEFQKGFVNLFATQFKERIFPLNKYMEKME